MFFLGNLSEWRTEYNPRVSKVIPSHVITSAWTVLVHDVRVVRLIHRKVRAPGDWANIGERTRSTRDLPLGELIFRLHIRNGLVLDALFVLLT